MSRNLVLSLLFAAFLFAGASADQPLPATDTANEAATAKAAMFLEGEWISQTKEKNPLIFEKDGKFACGFVQKKGKWVMAKGTWTIDEKGLVRAKATSGEASLGLWYRIVGEELHAPMGPNPNVIWKKSPKKAPKKEAGP